MGRNMSKQEEEIVCLISDDEDVKPEEAGAVPSSQEFVPFVRDAKTEVVEKPPKGGGAGSSSSLPEPEAAKKKKVKEAVVRNMHSHEGLPLLLPKSWKNQATVLAQLAGAPVENLSHHSGALGRMLVEKNQLTLDIGGVRYSGPLCPTVSCMVVTMQKDAGRVSTLVSDFCPLAYDMNLLNAVQGKLVRGTLDLENVEEDERKQRKRKAAAASKKKKKRRKSSGKK